MSNIYSYCDQDSTFAAIRGPWSNAGYDWASNGALTVGEPKRRSLPAGVDPFSLCTYCPIQDFGEHRIAAWRNIAKRWGSLALSADFVWDSSGQRYIAAPDIGRVPAETLPQLKTQGAEDWVYSASLIKRALYWISSGKTGQTCTIEGGWAFLIFRNTKSQRIAIVMGKRGSLHYSGKRHLPEDDGCKL